MRCVMGLDWRLDIRAGPDNERGVTGVTPPQDSTGGESSFVAWFVTIKSSFGAEIPETMELECNIVI